jgi:hypothetical protein
LEQTLLPGGGGIWLPADTPSILPPLQPSSTPLPLVREGQRRHPDPAANELGHCLCRVVRTAAADGAKEGLGGWVQGRGMNVRDAISYTLLSISRQSRNIHEQNIS